jgi:hypothetical protein
MVRLFIKMVMRISVFWKAINPMVLKVSGLPMVKPRKATGQKENGFGVALRRKIP